MHKKESNESKKGKVIEKIMEKKRKEGDRKKE